MKVKEDHAENKYFSAAFGIIIAAAGLAWFLQAIGVLPEEIKVLNYVCPICVVLVGVRIMMGHVAKGNSNKQQILEDTDGKM